MACDRAGADLPRALLRTRIRFVWKSALAAAAAEDMRDPSVDAPLDGMVSEWWWGRAEELEEGVAVPGWNW